MTDALPAARRNIADALRAERQLDVALVAYAERGDSASLAEALGAVRAVAEALEQERRRKAEAWAILARSA